MDCALCKAPRKDSRQFSSAEIVLHLEHLARNSVTAVNEKNFDMYDKAWSYLASTLVIEFAHPTYREPRRMALKEYLELLQLETDRWPQYRATILDQSTTVNDAKDEAIVFENAVVEGAPPGVATKLLIVLDFKLRLAPRLGEEPWRCVSLRSAIGI